MKKIVITNFILINIFLIIFNSKAQVQHLCGNDTIILHLKNYQYGSIQWEESEDSIVWKAIDGAIDTIYKFYPDGNKFYRAINSYALCPINYSDLFLVSVNTNANAGMDLRSSLSGVRLSANIPIGCTGQWSIFSGSGGSFENSTNPYTKFTGQTGQTFKLVWSLTNICGTSTDTVNVEFIQNSYRNNIVYVDTTDKIIRNNILQGHLNIKFSSPIPVVTDSSVLIFLTEDKYLLKVDSVKMNVDTAFMVVSQGSLQDFMVEGVIDFSPFNYKVDTLKRGFVNRLPSRKDILNKKFSNGQILFYRRNTSESFAIINNSKNSRGLYDDNTLSLKINPVEVYSDVNMTLKISGNIDFTPNLISYYDLCWLPPFIDTMIIKLDNAKLHYSLVPELIIKGTSNLVNIKKEWPLYQQDAIVMIGTVPIWISGDIGVKALFTIDASGTVDAKLTYTYDREYNAGIYYGQHNKKFTPFYYASEPRKTITPEVSGTASLNQDFQLGPEFSLKLFNTIGGSIEFYALKENFNACINNQLDWNANIDLSSELVIGGYLEIANKKFFEDDLKGSWTFGWFNDKFPSNMIKESGDMQTGTASLPLPNPVKVRVFSDWGIPLSYVNVYFEAMNGSVQNNIVKTDANGYATTIWTPDNTNGSQYLNAYINDCNSNIVSKTCFTCYVNAGTTDCQQSTLDMTLDINKNNNTIEPIAKRGVPPYKYSTDGINYQTSTPILTLTNGTTYKLYVKDNNGCIKSKVYKFNYDSCASSNITINISIDNKLKKIIVTPKGGKVPYQYAYITPSSYTSDSSHIFNSIGIYKVYVKDANNCEANSIITIDSIYSTTGTVTDIDGNIYHTVTIGTQIWMVENLKTTHYRNGDIIPNVSNGINWGALTSGAYCNYNNNASYSNIYGLLYNWYVVNDSRKIAPCGWHIPTKDEWEILSNYLGGDSISGGKLKETGTTHWLTPNTGADNCFGYTALPGGVRGAGSTSYFYVIGQQCYIWSSTEYDTTSAYYPVLMYNSKDLSLVYGIKNGGLSIRCIKDNNSTSQAPILNTIPITNITQTTAISGGNITNDGGAAITDRGVCWSISQNPTITDNKITNGIGTGSFTSNITGLTANTTYYVRAYATNIYGTGYGNKLSFTTNGTVTDIDGNIYHTITIGSQIWMVENLRVTHYRNGDQIPNIIDTLTWNHLITGAYCWWNNDSSIYANTYGALYNWYTVNDSRNICPTGWHVPTDAEWTVLTTYLGGENVAGSKLKETGTNHWLSPNTGATNETSFTALPGGYRYYNGDFLSLGYSGYLWSTTEDSISTAWYRAMSYYDSMVYRYYDNKKLGFSVRCVKD